MPRPLRAAIRRAADALARCSGTLAKARLALRRSDRHPADELLACISYVPDKQNAALLGSVESPGITRYRDIRARSAGAIGGRDRRARSPAHTHDRNIRTYLLVAF